MAEALAAYNVIATFTDPGQAREAVSALRNQHFDEEHISLLSRSAEARVSQEVARNEAEELPGEVAGRSAKSAVAGGAAGGAAGLLAGAAAFAIPGIGPAVGAGIWAAAGIAGGATAGATAGGVAAGITKMWEERYRDAVTEGSILIGVHHADPRMVEQAGGLLHRQGPDRVDFFDADGRPIGGDDGEAVAPRT
ncbi:MAG: hypothetical protein GEU68_01010 [Actinobacteria bacterium]|nr:hypothetical protein [Actinomycetota bacterium]